MEDKTEEKEILPNAVFLKNCEIDTAVCSVEIVDGMETAFQEFDKNKAEEIIKICLSSVEGK